MHKSLVLPRELTIYSVAELRPAWLNWLAAPDDAPRCADGAAVEEVDAAGLQMLIALDGSLSQQQQQLRLINASATLQAACQALGLSRLLDAAAAAVEATP
jgi:anti-anti-sigma regulatory factor